MATISIIIPIYNVAAYLPKCIESVQHQSFPDIEILLVNDGSTDNSPQICDQYALTDTRIRVIHQQNRGVSCARNKGIQNAQGDYITFVDSDDWISPEYLTILYDALQETPEASISFCEHYIVKDSKSIVNESFTGKRLYSAEEAIYQLCLDRKIRSYTWGKLYRKELFQEIHFPEDRTMCEDMAILYQLFYASGMVIHLSTPAYFYLTRPDSCINSGNNLSKSYQYFLAYFEMSVFIREKNLFPDKREYNERKLLRRGIHLLHRCIQSRDMEASQAIIKDTFPKLHALDHLKLKNIGLAFYLRRKLIYSNFPLYSQVYLFFRRKQ